MNECVWRNGGTLLTEENRSTREKPVPVPFCPQQIPVGLKPVPRSDRTATNSLSNGTTTEDQLLKKESGSTELETCCRLKLYTWIYNVTKRDHVLQRLIFYDLTTGYNVNDHNRNCKFGLEIQN